MHSLDHCCSIWIRAIPIHVGLQWIGCRVLVGDDTLSCLLALLDLLRLMGVLGLLGLALLILLALSFDLSLCIFLGCVLGRLGSAFFHLFLGARFCLGVSLGSLTHRSVVSGHHDVILLGCLGAQCDLQVEADIAGWPFSDL